MSETIIGARIRERRRQLGLAQAEVARRVGVSPSYLNLIERNKRPIAGGLLLKVAAALSTSLEALDGAEERRLHDALQELGGAAEFAALDVETHAIGELIGRYPGWARALVAAARAERDAEARARAMMDRLAHDPFLADATHEMLTRISAIRSAVDILEDYADLDGAARRRFVGIIRREARDLSETGGALAGYFDRLEAEDRALTPLDEVEALFEARSNRLDALERLAEELAETEAWTPAEAGPAARRRAAEAAAEARLGPAIEAMIAAEPGLRSSASRRRAERRLLAYAAAALLAPTSRFEAAAADHRYDIDALSDGLGLDHEIICRRLAALPRRAGAPAFGYFQANAAGAVIEAMRLRDLAAPRYGAGCPLWALFAAAQRPGETLRQRVAMPNGLRFVFVARARRVGATGYGQRQSLVADLAALSESDAALTVYGADGPVEPVGPGCRICTREDCAHRVDDTLFD